MYRGRAGNHLNLGEGPTLTPSAYIVCHNNSNGYLPISLAYVGKNNYKLQLITKTIETKSSLVSSLAVALILVVALIDL